MDPKITCNFCFPEKAFLLICVPPAKAGVGIKLKKVFAAIYQS